MNRVEEIFVQTTPTGPGTTSHCSHMSCGHIHRSPGHLHRQIIGLNWLAVAEMVGQCDTPCDPTYLSGHKTTPTREMTSKSYSGRYGADFGRKHTAGGPKTGPKLPGPKARGVSDRFMSVRCMATAKIDPKPARRLFLGHLMGGWFYGRLLSSERHNFQWSGLPLVSLSEGCRYLMPWIARNCIPACFLGIVFCIGQLRLRLN